jgi:hypothetical protein
VGSGDGRVGSRREIRAKKKIDDLVKNQKVGFFVIPAKAGFQLFQNVLGPGFRRGDDPRDFLRDHQDWFAQFVF